MAYAATGTAVAQDSTPGLQLAAEMGGCLLTDEGPTLQTLPLRISGGDLPHLQAWALKMLLLSQGAAAFSQVPGGQRHVPRPSHMEL